MKRSTNKIKLSFDRLLSKSLLEQFAILGIVLVVVFLLSWLFLHLSGCRWEDFCNQRHLPEWLLPLYLLIDTNALNNLYTHDGVHGWALIVSSIIYVIGLFIFNGMIISVLTNALERRVEKHREGHIHYLRSGHHVIMGYDDMVPSIISNIFKDESAYVLLLSSMHPAELREKLLKSFSRKQMDHLIINYGHRTSVDTYKNLHLESAEQIFIVGSLSRPAHDAINVECIDRICRYLKQLSATARPRRITCVFKDLDTYAAFKTSEIFGQVRELGMEFIPYNSHTGWAKQLFIKRKYRGFDNSGSPEQTYDYPAVYGEKGITPDDKKYVHLVFVGTTNLAVAVAMEAAHLLHFPNADKARTRITFIDINADKEKDEFTTRNRHFFEVQPYSYLDLSDDTIPRRTQIVRPTNLPASEINFLDVEFEFIKGNVFSRRVQDEISRWASLHGKEQQLSIFLALADQRQNFVMGMNMPDEVYDNEVPIFIRQDRSDNFVTNLRAADHREVPEKMNYSTVTDEGSLKQTKRQARYANIYPFGMNASAYSEDEQSLQRAKLINYLYATMPSANKFQEIFALDAMPEDKLWAEADKEWRKLSVANKWSNLYNAYTMQIKLASLRAMRGRPHDDRSLDTSPLEDNETETMARIEHNRWNVEKLLMGFRKPRSNEDKYAHSDYADELANNKLLFIHHDIRPFDELDDIQELDKELSRYIPWIMKMTEK